MRALSLFVVLVGFWLVNSGQLGSAYLVGAGVVCSLLVLVVALRMGAVDAEGHPVGFVMRGLVYLPWLLGQVAIANFDVAKRVWLGGRSIQPGLTRVPCALKSGAAITTYANSITMTPGTVTVSVDEDSFLVHYLHPSAAEGLLAGDMERRIAGLEGGAAAGGA